MNTCTSLLVAAAVATAVALPLNLGCSKQQTAQQNAPAHADHDGHSADEHASGDHHDGGHHAGHDHAAKALTEEDVKTPDSFAAGVTRLKELHQKINDLIEQNKLADVHRTAEEMAIVARKMKPLAARDIAEDKRTDAGRLCNDIAGYFSPIDEAADAGKKDETMKIHMQMADTIDKLVSLTK